MRPQIRASERSFSIASSATEALGGKVLELVGGDETFVPPFLRLLIDTDTATLKALLDAFHASNWDAAATASHRITGSLRMLDEARLIDLMSRFEAAIRAREIDDARSHLPRIVESFGHLLALLQKLFDSAAHP